MACLIFVEKSQKPKRVIRRRICFALTRLGCMYRLVLKEIRLLSDGLRTVCKSTLKIDRQVLKRPSPPKHLSA